MTDRIEAWLDERQRVHAAADTGHWYVFNTGVGSSALPPDEAVFEDAYMQKAEKSAVVDAHNHLPVALAAIGAVLDLHKPYEWSFGYEPVRSCTECTRLGGNNGKEEEAEWPCPTVRAVAGVLRREGDDDEQ